MKKIILLTVASLLSVGAHAEDTKPTSLSTLSSLLPLSLPAPHQNADIKKNNVEDITLNEKKAAIEDIKKLKTATQPIEVKAVKNTEVACNTTLPKHKLIHKHSKKPNVKSKKLKIKVNNKSTETNIELISNGNAETPESIYLKNMSQKNDSNTKASFTYTNKELLFNLSDIEGNPIKQEEFEPLENGELLYVYAVSSDLKKINKFNLNYNPIEVSNKLTLDKNNTCAALYATYHLKGKDIPSIAYGFINKSGVLSEEMDKSCAKNSEIAESDLTYTKSGNFMSIFKDIVPFSAKKPIEYTAIVSKKTVNFTPESLNSYIISDSMKYFYVAEKSKKYSNATKGTVYTKLVAPNDYTIVLDFKENDKTEALFSKFKVSE